ncbi:MAG: zinc-ribbon domain-containing protein [Lachnospiraceae bacterium]|nr:zinc-ribbon domain-containing protein [Lachnospiraceae bacterium]
MGTCGCGWDKSGNAPGRGSEQQQDTQTEQSQQPQILYCMSCGKQIETDSKFCRFCGGKTGM